MAHSQHHFWSVPRGGTPQVHRTKVAELEGAMSFLELADHGKLEWDCLFAVCLQGPLQLFCMAEVKGLLGCLEPADQAKLQQAC